MTGLKTFSMWIEACSVAPGAEPLGNARGAG
jgi:hypothetical protein